MGCANPGRHVARAMKLFKLALSAELVSCHPSGAKTFEVILYSWEICVPRRGTFKLVRPGLNPVRVRALVNWLITNLGTLGFRESVGMAFCVINVI